MKSGDVATTKVHGAATTSSTPRSCRVRAREAISRKTSPLAAQLRITCARHEVLFHLHQHIFHYSIMSDHTEDNARPAKRARLDDNSAPSLSADTSSQAPQAPATAPIAPMDTDLDREVRAGIIEYVCPDNLGFTGVLKQRYTDFLVNEIALDGQVLHLKSTSVPKKQGKKANGGQPNGTDAGIQKDDQGKLVLKEETGDVTMVDVQGVEVLEQKAPVKTEEAPAQEEPAKEANGEQGADSKEEEEKQEPQVEVCFETEPIHALLTRSSLPTKIELHYTTYLAKIQ